MRKYLCLLLALSLVLIPVRGQEPNYVVLTFDDGPSGRFTRRLLEGLAERQVQADFFLCGYRMEQYPELTAEIAAWGHEIGLHGYSHDSMAAMSPEQLSRELDRTQELLEKLTGQGSRLLRPPGGAFGEAVRAAARERGLTIVTWSADPRDWAVHDTQTIVRCVLETVQNGDVILLHDMWDSSVDAALAIVDALREKGYEFVTISRLAQVRGETLEPGSCVSRFLPYGSG